MSWTDGQFTFFSKNKLLSIGAFTFKDWDSAASDYTEPAEFNNFNNLLTRDRFSQEPFSFGAYADISTNNAHAILHMTLPGTMINCIAIQNIKASYFELHVNGSTLTINGAETVTASWENYDYVNSPNLIVRFDSIAANTVELYFYAPAPSYALVMLSEIYVLEEIYSLPRNPNFTGYKPKLSGLRDPLVLADDGIITYQMKEKFSADIDVNYAPQSVTAELSKLYVGKYKDVGQTITNYSFSSYCFCPYPTTGATAEWDGDIWEVEWIGNYEFLQPAINDRVTPLYSGKMRLRETPV